MEPFHRSMGKRRASHQNSEHELEVTNSMIHFLSVPILANFSFVPIYCSLGIQDQINEWANMTGFLVSLGGVCLQRKSPARKCNMLPNQTSQEVQYCPVTQ